MQVNVHEAKTNLSQLIERVLAGEEIIIARSGVPVARLSALQAPQPILGSAAGIGELKPGWDDPLTDAELEELLK